MSVHTVQDIMLRFITILLPGLSLLLDSKSAKICKIGQEQLYACCKDVGSV